MSRTTVKLLRLPSSTSLDLDWNCDLSLSPLSQPSCSPWCHTTPHYNLQQPMRAHKKPVLPPVACRKQVTPPTTQTGIVEHASCAYDTRDGLATFPLSTTRRLVGHSSRRSLNLDYAPYRKNQPFLLLESLEACGARDIPCF